MTVVGRIELWLTEYDPSGPSGRRFEAQLAEEEITGKTLAQFEAELVGVASGAIEKVVASIRMRRGAVEVVLTLVNGRTHLSVKGAQAELAAAFVDHGLYEIHVLLAKSAAPGLRRRRRRLPGPTLAENSSSE